MSEVKFPMCEFCGKEVVPSKTKKSVKMTLKRKVGEQTVITEHIFCDWSEMIAWSVKQKDHFKCEVK